MSKKIKGIVFVGAQYMSCNPPIEKFFKDHAAELPKDRPFFFVQHAHPAKTCYGTVDIACDAGQSVRALSPFPNAVALTGHSHSPLTDDRSVWQGAFTSIGTSSLRYSAATPEQWPAPGYENYSGHNDAKVMPRLQTGDGRQGMLVSVYDDAIAVSRREFVTDRSLGGDWVMPLPSAESKPFAYAERARSALAPAFAPGAGVIAQRAKGRTRGTGKKPSAVKET